MYKVKTILEGDDFALLTNEIRKDISNQILCTSPSDTERREELYWQAHGLALMEQKMQEYMNEISKENE